MLIKQHGEEAPIFVAKKADKRDESRDLDGCAVWKRVLRAVSPWRSNRPGKGLPFIMTSLI